MVALLNCRLAKRHPSQAGECTILPTEGPDSHQIVTKKMIFFLPVEALPSSYGFFFCFPSNADDSCLDGAASFFLSFFFCWLCH